ncbi:hypothetical protein SLS60_000279 [Paraconiothyrium brasiliense]|uniref:Uncharacterized protein n=1 Tax=Paraconiothyrium brasiliense TaxID=300254 RepID=A0ABR3S5S6_9PLEO
MVHSVNEGDSVWIVNGCRTPLILTRSNSSKEQESGGKSSIEKENYGDPGKGRTKMFEIMTHQETGTGDVAEGSIAYESHKDISREGQHGPKGNLPQHLIVDQHREQEQRTRSVPVKTREDTKEEVTNAQHSESQDLVVLASKLRKAEARPDLMETYRIVGPCYLFGLKDLDCWTPGSSKRPLDFDPFRVMKGKSEVIGIV